MNAIIKKSSINPGKNQKTNAPVAKNGPKGIIHFHRTLFKANKEKKKREAIKHAKIKTLTVLKKPIQTAKPIIIFISPPPKPFGIAKANPNMIDTMIID